MKKADKGVSSAIATVLMVAIVVVLSATVSVSFFDVAEDVNEPAPNVADTTGEFVPGSGGDEQVVRITHIAGDSIDIENIEIIVRASGPGDDLPTEARLVNLPGDNGKFYPALPNENIEGNDDLITQNSGLFGRPPDKIIIKEDSNVWSAGNTIQFAINSGGADFRDSAQGDPNEADELEVIIVHTPSNSILAEHTFTPQRS